MTPSDPDSVVLRPAVEADVSAIAAVEEASFSHPGERFGLRRVRHLTVSPRPIVIVAAAPGRLLGWVAGFVWLRGKVPWGRVYAIAVDPKSRGQRLGQRLMEAMLAELAHRGAVQIFLEVRADNHPAVRLYQKLGFAECRKLPGYYGPGLHGIRMVRVTASPKAALTASLKASLKASSPAASP